MEKLLALIKSEQFLSILPFLAIGVVVLIAIILIVIFSIVGSKKKQIRLLEKKLSELKAPLTGQDAQYVHRLETIARSNLSFSETYERVSKEFRGLLEGDYKSIEASVKRLKTLQKDNNSKEFKTLLQETKQSLSIFKQKLSTFEKYIQTIIKPEEDSRGRATKVREGYRAVKQNYHQNSQQLSFINESFEKVFSKIDVTFEKFEDFVERGEYEEANKLMPTIEQVNVALGNAIKNLPSLCLIIDDIIPNRIEELKGQLSDFEKGGIPIFHLCLQNRIQMWNTTLSSAKYQLKQFKSAGIKETLDKVNQEIDKAKEDLENELIDKAYFDENLDSIYTNAASLEKNFLKIVAKIPELNQVYVVELQKQNELEILKVNINKVDESKRDLDNLLHCGTKQPYSILKSKLVTLKSAYDVALEGLNGFKGYIEGIKGNSEEAYDLIYSYYYKLKELESNIRQMNIPGYIETVEDEIKDCYGFLNDLDEAIRAKPIDVTLVNERTEILKERANSLFAKIEKAIQTADLAESAIVFNNRDRLHQNDVHQKLKYLEGQFFERNFDKVYQQASDLYQTKHVEDGRNGK